MPETLTLAQRLAKLPQWYTYKEVLAVCQGDEMVFIEAWCGTGFPPEVRAACRETMPAEYLQELLLRRVSRQLGVLIAHQQKEPK